MGDRRHARERRHARAATTARPTIPGPTGCGRSSSGTASTCSASRRRSIRALMAHGDEPVRAHDLSSLRILASTGEPWNEAPWRWYFDVVGGGRCPVINISRRHRGRRVLPRRRTSSQPISPCSLGGPALGMAVDVFDDDGPPGARRGRRARVHEAVAGDDPRAVAATRERYLETYWSRWPGVWWHGDFASIERRRPVVPARSLRRHDQARGQAARSGRGRDRRRRASRRCVEAAAVGVPDELKGEALWVFVVVAARASTPTTRCAPSCGARVADALGPSFTPVARCASPTRCRRRAAPRCCGARSARSSPATTPGDLSGLEDPAALDAIAVAASATGCTELDGCARVVLRPLRADDWDAWREVRLRCRDWLERGSRGRSRGAPIRRSTARRSAPAAARGTASVTSTRPTASGCSSPTASSRAR